MPEVPELCAVCSCEYDTHSNAHKWWCVGGWDVDWCIVHRWSVCLLCVLACLLACRAAPERSLCDACLHVVQANSSACGRNFVRSVEMDSVHSWLVRTNGVVVHGWYMWHID